MLRWRQKLLARVGERSIIALGRKVMKALSISIFLLAAMCNFLFAQEEPGPEAAAFLERVASLDQQGKLEDALKLLDLGLEKYREPNFDRFFTLNYKFQLLSRLNRFRDAVDVAVEKANIIKSPKQALIVAEAYLKINDLGQALDWVERSVNRGLQSYDIFHGNIYDPLRDKERFTALIEKVKRKNGIGQPAQSFIRESLSGNEVSLHKYKGRVLLIDFWATWCFPCTEQMPHLKKCYKNYRDKGFEIIGFSLDGDKNTLGKYLKSTGIDWEIISCPKAQDDETINLYKVINIPASFLVDKNGILRHVNLTGKNLENAIEELLNE